MFISTLRSAIIVPSFNKEMAPEQPIIQFPQKPYEGYIFDCDGTLADSMALHHKAWQYAFREHGVARRTLDAEVSTATAVMTAVDNLGLPFQAATDQLVVDGVKLFVDAWDKLLASVAGKRDALEAADRADQ